MQPTQTEIKQYCDCLENYLYAQKWKIRLTLSETPFNTNLNKQYNEEWWLDDVIVTLPNNQEIKLPAIFAGLTVIDNHTNHIFDDAYNLQNAIYSNLKIQNKAQKDLSDPYWKLWDKIK